MDLKEYSDIVGGFLGSYSEANIKDSTVWSGVYEYFLEEDDNCCLYCENDYLLTRLVDIMKDTMPTFTDRTTTRTLINFYFRGKVFNENDKRIIQIYDGDLSKYYIHEFNDFLIRVLYKHIPKKFNYYDPSYRKLRHEVFIRDGEICAKCGEVPGPDVSLTVDHIKPVSKYPELSMDINNLQVLCWKCNQSKSNKNCTDYRSRKNHGKEE